MVLFYAKWVAEQLDGGDALRPLQRRNASVSVAEQEFAVDALAPAGHPDVSCHGALLTHAIVHVDIGARSNVGERAAIVRESIACLRIDIDDDLLAVLGA